MSSSVEPLDATLESLREALADLVRRHADSPAINGLFLVRHEENIRSMPTLAHPALCILAQGSKAVHLGDERYVYDPLHYMVVSVAMPISGVYLDASPENPSLGIRLDIDPAEINNLIAEAGPMGVPAASGRGLFVERLDLPLLDPPDPPAGYAQGHPGARTVDPARDPLPPAARKTGPPAV